jgi:hypothetical protein
MEKILKEQRQLILKILDDGSKEDPSRIPKEIEAKERRIHL